MPADNLGSKSRKGLAWDLAGGLLRHAASLLVSIILARLLLPAQFGVIGMAMAFVSFSQIFIDVGFTEGLIHRQNVTPTTYSSIFFVNLAIGLLISAILFLCSSAIGAFYQDDEITSVVRYLALIPPVAALGKVQGAIFMKNLNFKALAVRDILATVLGGIAGVVAAIDGAGVYSLIWQQVVTAVTGMLLLWRGSKWRPSLLFSWTDVREVFRFSGFVFADRLVQHIFDKVDTIFVGKVFSPATLGFYSRAESLKSFIDNYSSASIGKVAFPVFSSMQDDRERFNALFIKAITTAVVVTTFLVGTLFFISDWIIILLLGEKWRASVPLFQILIFTSITLPFRTILYKAMLGLGYSSMKFRMGLFSNLITLVSLPVGYFYGIEAFAWSYVGSRVVTTAINWFVLKKKMQLTFSGHFNNIVIPVFILAVFVVLYYWDVVPVPGFVMALSFAFFFILILRQMDSIGLDFMLKEITKLATMLRNRIKGSPA